MDNQTYLNQISASVAPPQKPKSGIFSSMYFKLGAVAVVALILIIIVGNILGGNKGDLKTRTAELKLRLDNTVSVISDYQPKVKSSTLRSNSASLYGVLSGASLDLSTYLTEKYNFKEKDLSKKITEQATLEKEGLESELFEAKINGRLDRIYAHKMAYEISVISSKAASLLKSAKDEDFKLMLDKFITSLDNLYNKFNDFTEGE